eukprot:4504159-Amphidinium_carterae.1
MSSINEDLGQCQPASLFGGDAGGKKGKTRCIARTSQKQPTRAHWLGWASHWIPPIPILSMQRWIMNFPTVWPGPNLLVVTARLGPGCVVLFHTTQKVAVEARSEFTHRTVACSPTA